MGGLKTYTNLFGACLTKYASSGVAAAIDGTAAATGSPEITAAAAIGAALEVANGVLTNLGSSMIWACKIDPVTRHRVGDAFEIRLFRGARRSMMPFNNSGMTRPAVARNKIVFPLGEETGNIWTTKLPTPQKP